MRKAAYSALTLVVIISVAYMLGPRPEVPELNPTPMELIISIDTIDNWIASREASVENLKPENESTIFWVHDSVMKTEYSVVYLHGLSASRMEGNPVHCEFAKRYGMNMYLPRLQIGRAHV